MEEEILVTPAPGPFFRFPDESTGRDAIRSAGFLTEDGEYITASHHHSLRVIGIITRGGKYDEDGNELVAPTTLDGWHVNYQGDLPDGWEQYAVYPQNPYRVFA